MHEFCVEYMYDSLLLKSFFSCFWKIPETAWRAIHSCQVTHPSVNVFWVHWMNRLAVKPCTARQRVSTT